MLTGERWERLQALFHLAADRPRAEWRPFLDAESSGDTELVDRVMAMLEADAVESSVLDRDTVTWRRRRDVSQAPWAPHRPYRIRGSREAAGRGVPRPATTSAPRPA